MEIVVIEPHGFCAGVTAALRKALALPAGGGAVYCLHELVHNEVVVDELKARGFAFVESIDEVPAGATVLFSAHGVSPAVRERARRRALNVVDATCPFVERVHKAARSFAERGLSVVVIGHPSHAEVRGIVGEAPGARVIAGRDAALALPSAAGERIGVV
ncbi:MAG: 4-hydroxy-3-methylbut-2-enyl diphosphate reductase, partial [Kiritimatiellae bacterium]|nr:4-hydroxy-3-methylbut-2-enyl diphosphate reductase [Kiritimatiellia bacterium]